MVKRVLVLHGGNIYPSYDVYVEELQKKEVHLDRMRAGSDWKQELPNVLGSEYDVLLPRMPLSDNAEYALWKLWFERIVPVFGEPCILVGHSLGAMFLVKYLTENKLKQKVPKLVLVSPEYMRGKESMDAWGGNFILQEDLSMLVEQVEDVVFFHSEDDPVVPYESFLRFREVFPQAQFLSFKDRGHFTEASFPEIIGTIKQV